MRDDKIRMPSSSAGVMSFYDEERSVIRLKPMHIVIMCILVAAVVIVMNLGVFS
jgi:preprotein translocase subunit Sec61beta